MLTKASSITTEVRTRAEVGERAGSTGGLVRTLTTVGLACLILAGTGRAQGVVAWGFNPSGQCNVPALPPLPGGVTYVEVAAGGYHTVARRSDGSVVAWGRNNVGQCTVPAPPSGLTYVEVAAGGFHTVARRSDGSVVAWGLNGYGQCNVPALPAGSTFVEVAAGGYHSVARRSDGSVVAWGGNYYGQCTVPALPSGLTYVEISAGGYENYGDPSHTVARRSDGSVVAWGYNGPGQCNVPVLPAGLTYVGIAAGGYHTVARFGLAASVVSVGTGCGGVGSPVFGCTPPRIGTNFTFTLAQATPFSAGVMLSSVIPAFPVPLGSGCTVAIDLATFAELIPLAANATGAWGLTLFLPFEPSLVGLQTALQIVTGPTAGPFGLDLSNGLYLTLGY